LQLAWVLALEQESIHRIQVRKAVIIAAIVHVAKLALCSPVANSAAVEATASINLTFVTGRVMEISTAVNSMAGRQALQNYICIYNSDILNVDSEYQV
jgi:hypothetical protein